MYNVIKELCSPVFGNFEWYRIITPNGMAFQAYLNQDYAYKICEKLNSQRRLTQEEKAICRAKAEEKRLQKIVDKLEN